MARSFLTAINLNKNELQNAAVQNLGTAPAAPVKGQLYFNSTGGDNTLYWWDGASWVPAKASGGAFPGYGSVPAETTFGITKNDGAATTVARSDHTHGSPLHDDAAHSAVHLNALAVPNGYVSMGGYTLTNVGLPSNPGDSASKLYVDNAVAGLSWKTAVYLATTGNIALTGNQTIDGIGTASSQSVLVKDQTAPAENGIYLTSSGAWTRRTDADSSSELSNAAVFVQRGTVNNDTAWVCTTDPIGFTLGTTPVTWAQFAGGGAVVAGAGLTQSGNTVNVIAGDATLTVAADSIVRAPLTGDVTTAINAATISANAVDNTKLADMPGLTLKGNDTGAAGDPKDLTIAQVVQGMGFIRKTVASIPAGTTASFSHGFAVRNVLVEVYRNATPWDTVDCDITRPDFNTVTTSFATAVAANEYIVVMIG